MPSSASSAARNERRFNDSTTPHLPGEHRTTGHRALIKVQRDIRAGVKPLARGQDICTHRTYASTHLDPFHHRWHVRCLQQKLLPLEPHPDHVPPLDVVAAQPALCVLEGVRTDQVMLGRIRRAVMVMRPPGRQKAQARCRTWRRHRHSNVGRRACGMAD